MCLYCQYVSVCVSWRLVESVDLSISLYKLYPARSPPAGWSCVTNKTREEVDLCPLSGDDIRSHLHPDLPTLHRDSTDQAIMQAVSLIITLLLSAVRFHNITIRVSLITVLLYSGAVSGLVIKIIGRSGSTLPVEAWYDGTCFLDTPSFREPDKSAERGERGERGESGCHQCQE